MIRTAVGAIIMCEGKYLLVHKISNEDIKAPTYKNGIWDFVKGGIKHGETPQEALRRELVEEINIRKYQIIKEIKEHLLFKFPDSSDSKYEMQDTTFFLITIDDRGQIIPDGKEINDYCFCSTEEVINKLTHVETIEFFKANFPYNNEPCVSVVMPAYNRENTIRKAINSVLNQTITSWELCIVDDGSTDKTTDIVFELQKSDSRIKLYNNNHKKGVSGARNTAFEYINGKYVAFLDSDDEWDKKFLEMSLKAIEDTDVDVVFSLWSERNLDGTGYKIYSEEFAQKKLNAALHTLNPVKQGKYYIFNNRLFYDYVLTNNFYCFHINTIFLK